jgi:hypothetical protein
MTTTIVKREEKWMRPPTKPELLGLTRYDKMLLAIEECHRVDEAKHIRGLAKMFEVYAKQAGNSDAELRAQEVRMRAERHCGMLLKEMQKRRARATGHGDQKSESRHATPISTLKDLGVTKDQSYRWQKMAEIPNKEFESQFGKGKRPTTSGLVREQGEKAKPKPDPELLHKQKLSTLVATA